jgi:hypothetical protein
MFSTQNLKQPVSLSSSGLQTIALQLLEKLIKIHIPGCIPELWS